MKNTNPKDYLHRVCATLMNEASECKRKEEIIYRAMHACTKAKWKDVASTPLKDGQVYAVRRVWLKPRKVGKQIAVATWNQTYHDWEWVHGLPEPGIGNCSLEVWVPV